MFFEAKLHQFARSKARCLIWAVVHDVISLSRRNYCVQFQFTAALLQFLRVATASVWYTLADIQSDELLTRW